MASPSMKQDCTRLRVSTQFHMNYYFEYLTRCSFHQSVMGSEATPAIFCLPQLRPIVKPFAVNWKKEGFKT